MKNNTSISSSFLPLRWAAHEGMAIGLTGILHSQTYPTTALLILATCFFLLQFRSETRKDRRHDPPPANEPQLPPGPQPWPLVGCIPELLVKKPAFRWILALMKEMNTDIACVRLGTTHVIPVTCPEIAREFLKKQDANFASRPLTMGTEYSSRGYLSVAVAPLGEQWKKMRRVVASEVLSAARLRWLHDKRLDEADNLMRYLYNKCTAAAAATSTGTVVDVRKAVRFYSGNVIRKLMFNQRYFGAGSNDGGPGPEEEEHVEALFTVLSLLYAFNVSDYIPRLRFMDLDGHERIMKKAIKIVNRYHEPLIDDRINKWRNSRGGPFKKEPEDLLDILISIKDTDGKPILSVEEIKAQAAVRNLQ